MKIEIPLEFDTDNTYCEDIYLKLAKSNHYGKIVVSLSDSNRQVMVSAADLKTALIALFGEKL